MVLLLLYCGVIVYASPLIYLGHCTYAQYCYMASELASWGKASVIINELLQSPTFWTGLGLSLPTKYHHIILFSESYLANLLYHLLELHL